MNAIAEMYTDGHLAGEIEHLLVLRLHGLNTVDEVEELKAKILAMMEDMYSIGQERADAKRKDTQ